MPASCSSRWTSCASKASSVAYEQVASSPLADQSIGTLIDHVSASGRPQPAWRRPSSRSTARRPSPRRPRSWNPFRKKSTGPAAADGDHDRASGDSRSLGAGHPQRRVGPVFQAADDSKLSTTRIGPMPHGAQLTVTINGNAGAQELGPGRRVQRAGAARSPRGPTGGVRCVPRRWPACRTARSRALRAYRELLARAGTPDAAAASLAASPFSMAPAARRRGRRGPSRPAAGTVRIWRCCASNLTDPGPGPLAIDPAGKPQ